MVRGMAFVWRLVCTGFAFAALGLGGSLLAAAAFPPIAWLTRDPVLRQRRVQQLIRLSFRLYIAMLQLLGLISLRVADAERLRGLRGALVVANHPTLLDVVLLMALVPRAQCIVKHQLWQNRFLRGVVSGAGYIRNDRDPQALMADCVETLGVGNNLIVFPEGTRSTPGQPLRLRRGFANIATLARADVQVITISCAPPTLTKGEPWYRIPPERPSFSVAVGDRLDILEFLRAPSRPLAARRLLAFLEHHYADALTNGQSGARYQAFDRAGAQVGRLVA